MASVTGLRSTSHPPFPQNLLPTELMLWGPLFSPRLTQCLFYSLHHPTSEKGFCFSKERRSTRHSSRARAEHSRRASKRALEQRGSAFSSVEGE